MTNDELRKTLMDVLGRIARGELGEDERDRVPGSVRVEMGAMEGRRFELDVVEREEDGDRQRLVLARGAARVVVTLTTTGAFIFTFGDGLFEVPDRVAGAAFADELAALFGTLLDFVPMIDLATAQPLPLAVSWARIGRRRDADGVAWEVLKLFAGDGERYGELFLRLSDRRAVLSEKWSAYRAAWITMIETAFGRGRGIERRRRLAIGGGATVTVPAEWTASDAGGHWRVTDPDDRVVVELSWLRGGSEPDLPRAAERVRLVLEAEGDDDTPIVVTDRGDVELAWAERGRLSGDTRGGPRRLAHHRLLIAVGERGQVVVTTACWPEDSAWFAPAWDRMISTLVVP